MKSQIPITIPVYVDNGAYLHLTIPPGFTVKDLKRIKRILDVYIENQIEIEAIDTEVNHPFLTAFSQYVVKQKPHHY